MTLHEPMSGQAMMTPGETHTVSLDNLAQQLALVDGAIVQDENAPVTRVGGSYVGAKAVATCP